MTNIYTLFKLKKRFEFFERLNKEFENFPTITFTKGYCYSTYIGLLLDNKFCLRVFFEGDLYVLEKLNYKRSKTFSTLQEALLEIEYLESWNLT